MDVMHLEGNMFLVTVVDPLNLTLQSYVDMKVGCHWVWRCKANCHY
jgi:hypothetical protein